ncbi:hypothetical protein HDV57DRAFT_510493 [Trichoderma longibrachiatum]
MLAMADSAHMTTISAKSRNVRQQFIDLITLTTDVCKDGFSDSQRSVAADSLDRFSLWAGNMGAMRSSLSPPSLDQLLHEAVDIREQIDRQLDEITEAIADLTNIVRHTNPKRDTAIDLSIISDIASMIGLDLNDEMNASALDEADMLLQIISESVKSLLRLGILVRKISPRDDFQRALSRPDSAFLELPDIDYVKQRFEKLRNSQLSNRLGSAIAKRRQFIRYCRDRNPRPTTDATQENTARMWVSSEATTSVSIPDIQSGNILKEESEDISPTSASAIGGTSSSLKLPLLYDLSKAHEPFQCPVCFTLQCFQSEKEWQTHAFSDLKAYVCTMGGAECDTEFFGDRDAWFEHELRNHRCHYSCILCSHGSFSSQSLLDHITKAHGSFSDSQSEMLQNAGREVPTLFLAKDCPFCDEWAENLLSETTMKGRASDPAPEILVNHSRFKEHIAMHHEHLAIFAMERAPKGEDVSNQESTASSDTKMTKPPPLQASDDVALLGTPTTGVVDANDDMDINREAENSPLQMTADPTIDIRGDNDTSEATFTSAARPNARRRISRAARQQRRQPRPSTRGATRRLGQNRTVSINIWQCCRCDLSGLHIQIHDWCPQCVHMRCSTCSLSTGHLSPGLCSR